jgi:hypothetical protein
MHKQTKGIYIMENKTYFGDCGQFIVMSKHNNTGCFSMSEYPCIHDNYEKACAEADRLAGIYTNKTFIVVSVKYSVKANAAPLIKSKRI